MATSGPTQLPAFFVTDADFRTWVSGVINAITAVGLVQTADTGQINPATVLTPGGANVAQGYTIWRFSDPLQATLPVFIKVEFGSGGAISRPALWVTVGTTTNGAGILGGQLSNRTQVAGNAAKSAGVTLPLYASGSTDRIHMGLNLDFAATGFGMFWGVERTKDSTGTNTADGIVVYGFQPLNASGFQVIPASGAVPAVGNGPCMMIFPKSQVGLDVAVSPGIYFLGKAFFSLLLAHITSDIGWGTPFNATVYGTPHTYMSLSGAMYQTHMYGNGTVPTNYSLAMLWE